MYFPEKPEILKGGGGGVHDYGILRAWGGHAFWSFRRQGGVKTWKPSVVGYGYFLELPNLVGPKLHPTTINYWLVQILDKMSKTSNEYEKIHFHYFLPIS